MLKKFDADPGDLDSSLSACSSRRLQFQKDAKPHDEETLGAAEGLQHMGSFPEAVSLPSALMMC